MWSLPTRESPQAIARPSQVRRESLGDSTPSSLVDLQPLIPRPPSKCEAVLDMLANNLQVEFTSVLENVMILLDGLVPGPYKELVLRPTLRFIETFADVPFKLDNTPSTRIRKYHYNVLSMPIVQQKQISLQDHCHAERERISD
jgi:hypothetical protein